MCIFQNPKFLIRIAYVCCWPFALEISASEMPRTDTLPARQEVSRKLAGVKVQACMLCEELSVKMQQGFARCKFSHFDFLAQFVAVLVSLHASLGGCMKMQTNCSTFRWRQHVLHATSWDHTLKCR